MREIGLKWAHEGPDDIIQAYHIPSGLMLGAEYRIPRVFLSLELVDYLRQTAERQWRQAVPVADPMTDAPKLRLHTGAT